MWTRGLGKDETFIGIIIVANIGACRPPKVFARPRFHPPLTHLRPTCPPTRVSMREGESTAEGSDGGPARGHWWSLASWICSGTSSQQAQSTEAGPPYLPI